MVGAAEMNPVSTFTMSSYGVRPSPMTVNFVTAGMGGMMGEYQIPIGTIDSSVCLSFLPKKVFNSQSPYNFNAQAGLLSILSTQFVFA